MVYFITTIHSVTFEPVNMSQASTTASDHDIEYKTLTLCASFLWNFPEVSATSKTRNRHQQSQAYVDQSFPFTFLFVNSQFPSNTLRPYRPRFASQLHVQDLWMRSVVKLSGRFCQRFCANISTLYKLSKITPIIPTTIRDIENSTSFSLFIYHIFIIYFPTDLLKNSDSKVEFGH